MATLNKSSIVTAISSHSKLDLTFDHATTMNFMNLQPVGYRRMIKGEKFSLNSVATVRPAPMAVPTYGRMRLNIRNFFIPFRVVFPMFDSFYTDVIGVNASAASLVSKVPTIESGELVKYFLNTVIVGEGALVSAVATATPQPAYDFQSGTQKYKFTVAGKRRVKLLHSLGYRWNWNDKDTTQLSLLNLFAYAKVYLDWYCNSQYLNSNDVIAIKKAFAYNDPSSPLTLTSTTIGPFLSLICSVVYDADYFVSAWDNPVAPNSGQFTQFTFFDPTSSNGSYVNNVGGTSEMFQQSSSSVSLGTTYLHSALKMLTDYSKRHQLSGAYEIDRYLAQFGVATPALKLQRSIYLGGKSIDVNVGDVMSTANTAGSGNVSNLGDYAGQGFGQDSAGVEYTTDEYGLFLTVASILPSGGMWQGVDRHNLDITKFDFYQPEADSLGVQAIARSEVYISNDSSFGSATDYDASFGYTARYGHYKRPLSFVTGDLELPSAMAGGDSWHLMRTFNDASFGGAASNISHSLAFTRGDDWEEYNRIFNSTTSDNDKFIVDFHHDAHALAPCRSLFDTYEFEEGDKQVTLDANGSKLN